MKKKFINKDQYRKDNRSEKEFRRDIKIGNQKESKIMKMYAKYHQHVHGKTLKYMDNGCDNTGEYLDIDNISTDVDYTIEGQPFEIKFNNHYCRSFHLKLNQLNSYIKQDANILWVNAFESDNPVFTILSLEELKKIKETKDVVRFKGWGGKKCVRLYSNEFDWTPLLQTEKN